jgi:dienelactone hydrolase
MEKSKDKNLVIYKSSLSYFDNKTPLEGFITYPENNKFKKPGILVIHEWTGIGTLVKTKALKLAEMGYIAMCADIYGKDIRSKNPEEALKISTIYKNDRALLRSRLILALNELKKLKNVDCNKLAVIGFCFGGMAALELARANSEIRGAVSFHGSLNTPEEFKEKYVKPKILVLHGAEDPLVPQNEVLDFISEMKKSQADWQMHIYGGAYHSFMNPESGDNRHIGIAYNEKIAHRAWIQMQLFFDEIFL